MSSCGGRRGGGGPPGGGRARGGAGVWGGELAGERLVLAKPVLFMNNSGDAVGALAGFYKVPREKVLVVYDDLALSVGDVRLRSKGGHGGHNGVRDIIRRFGGDKGFPRLRIGIGQPPGRMDQAAFVLRAFDKRERPAVDEALYEAADIVEKIMREGMERALSTGKPRKREAGV